jgi:hypothetical protein
LVLPLVTGCGVGPTIPGSIVVLDSISGNLRGGQQPVAGATVTLYAPSLTGYGLPSTPIVSTTSDGQGNFTLPRPYTCPTNSGDIYILATGGNSGSGTNGLIALATLLGPCSSLGASSYIEIDEVTTIAAAYALAPFAIVTPTLTGIGTSPTNLAGLNNAFGPASSLVNTTTGLANGVNSISGLILPTAEVNTLADILAACINTNGALTLITGGITSPSPCGTLVTAATPPGGVAPLDTFQAALDIALNPGNNAATLFALSTPTAPFQPTLPSSPTPTDFALGIVFTGHNTGLGYPTSLDIDAAGNAWVGAVGSGGAVPAENTIVEISPSGQYLANLDDGSPDTVPPPNGVAIAGNGSIYVSEALSSQNDVGHYLLQIDPNTHAETFLHPASLLDFSGVPAIDNRTSTLWLPSSADIKPTYTQSITQATFAGADAPGSPYTVPGAGFNSALGDPAIDGSGNIWFPFTDPSYNASLLKFSPPAVPGNPYTQQTFALGPNLDPCCLAIDHAGSLWSTADIPGTVTPGSVTRYTPAIGVTAASTTTFLLNKETVPGPLAIDGDGRIFLGSQNNENADGNYNPFPGALTVLSNSGALISTSGVATSGGPLLGYSANGILPYQLIALRIDSSGNVWSVGEGANDTSPYSITEIIGIAAPVVTPLSVAASTNTLGHRP